MIIGVPKEIKAQEHRVGLTPAAIKELLRHGHSAWVERGAGVAIGLSDQDYSAAGAQLADDGASVYQRADLIVKVKELQPSEYDLLRCDQLLFTYLHLAPDPQQAAALIKSGASCIAYETVTDKTGALPLLTPMSEIAGRLAVQAAAHCLELPMGGPGVLLAGVPGVPPAQVLILGGGVVGLNAARMALGLGAQVTIADRSLARLRAIDEAFSGRITTLYATQDAIETQLPSTQVVIGAVLIPGAAAPKLIDKHTLGLLQPGSVLVDVAIDQGGCFATSKPTTHLQPTFSIDGVVHYCVANMPGAVARTATLALGNATLPYVIELANKGLNALQDDPGFAAGLNVHQGKITHPAVARALNLPLNQPC